MNKTKGILVIIVLILITLFFVLSGRHLFITKKLEEKKRVGIEKNIKSLREDKESIGKEIEAIKVLHGKLESDLNDVKKQIKTLEDDSYILKESKVELSAKIEEADEVLKEGYSSLEDMDRKKAELANLSQRLTEEKNAIGEMSKQISIAKEGLENRIKGLIGQGVSLKPVVVKAHNDAQVVAVNTEFGFVVTNLGGADFKIGRLISIYRDEVVIAHAKVDRIRDGMSTAVLLPEWKGVEIRVGDSVTSAD